MLHPIGTPRQIDYNILDVIQEYAPRSYKQTSNPRSKYLMQCPLDDDRQRHDSSGSFSINADGSLFLCFGCGAKGNAFQLRQILSRETNFLASNEGHQAATTVRRSKTSMASVMPHNMARKARRQFPSNRIWSSLRKMKFTEGLFDGR